MTNNLGFVNYSKYKIGIVTCLVSYLAYCLYENFHKDQRKLNNVRNNRRYKTKGIKRTNGVTCYLNSIFLMLSNSISFIDYINNINQAKKDLLENGEVLYLPLHEFLHDVLIQLLTDKPEESISNGLYISREKIFCLEKILNFSLLKQNDWLEVLEKIIHILDKEKHKLTNISAEQQSIASPFQYNAKTSTYCSKCKQQAEHGSQLNKQDDDNVFLLINLDFAYKKTEYKNSSLISLIEKSMYQQIEDYTCSYCTLKNYILKTKDTTFDLKGICLNTDLRDTFNVDFTTKYQVKTTLIKRKDIIDYPRLIVFNLNRFAYNYSGISNRDTSTYFNFDKEMILNNTIYQLNTLVKHSGNAKIGGHYQVFNKKPVVLKEKVDGEIKYRLKHTPVTEETKSLKNSKDIDLGDKLNKDYWLINDDNVKDKSLMLDINPYDSNMIVGLVYERIT